MPSKRYIPPKAKWHSDMSMDIEAFAEQIEYLLEAELLSSHEDPTHQEQVTNGARMFVEAWHAGTVRIEKPLD